MKVLGTAVFEHIVYNVRLLDRRNPTTLQLVVDAVLRPGDADGGPLLVPAPELAAVIGDEPFRTFAPSLRAEGRIVVFHGVNHVAFPLWTGLEHGETIV